MTVIPFECTLDANGWFCLGVTLPATKTALDIVSIVMDAASPYDGANNAGPWHFASAAPDFKPITAGTCRVVVKGDPGQFFTGRVYVL